MRGWRGTQVGRDSGWGCSLWRGRPSVLARGAVVSAPTLPPRELAGKGRRPREVRVSEVNVRETHAEIGLDV